MVAHKIYYNYMVQERKESTLEKKDKTFLMKDHDSLSGKMFKSFPSQRDIAL